MSGLLGEIRRLNGLGNRSIAEPFAGGAGASLTLLYLEETPEIYINDADRAIYEFWWAILNRPRLFSKMLADIDVDIDEWYRQREVYRSRDHITCLRRGFATFYLNRCNRSGIIMNGGPIGGVGQTGKWKLDARFNKSDLCRRCDKIAEYRDRVHATCRDGLEFIDSFDPARIFFFIDPPYFAKGKTLYLNALNEAYHRALAARLRTMVNSAWVLTYDDCPEIRAMYEGWTTVRPFSFRYVAAQRRSGREVLIAPKWLRLPPSQASAAIGW